jgi:hypothetical protein
MAFHLIQTAPDDCDINIWDFPSLEDAEYARCIAALDAIESGSGDTYRVTDADYRYIEA